MIKPAYIFSILAVLILGCAIILVGSDSPEKLLIGKWQEVSWEYEKINSEKESVELHEKIKEELYKNLIIHKSEIWEFDKDRKLVLFNKKNLKEILNWNIKGRGNILELQHKNMRLENYQVQEISKNKLVIHISFDLQIRGIVKLTFKRIEEPQYAEKI